ncbi:hypothetical protein EK21DRAFT_118535 [Setomelanomma holmii]|uniref:Uncharacterized protein n=1 Tax=Setomelanomma holmii TaxID=210430 RepID=A0A9P4GXT8_9PLEO|nr:hypothetical protein EK21DRAFT_118535 [Setomelanomma holmii]
MAGATVPDAASAGLAAELEKEEWDDANNEHDGIVAAHGNFTYLTLPSLHTHSKSATSGTAHNTTAPPYPPRQANAHTMAPQDHQTLTKAKLFTPPDYANTTAQAQSQNPFSSLTSEEIGGFQTARDTIAQNELEAAAVRQSQRTLQHTPGFAASYRPLGPGENLFDITNSRRLHNVVGGWVASDGSPTPEAEVLNTAPEPAGGRVGRVKGGKGPTRRGKRGGKDGRKRTAKATAAMGGKGTGNDTGAFEDTEEFMEEKEKDLDSDLDLDPEANVFTPGCMRFGGGGSGPF